MATALQVDWLSDADPDPRIAAAVADFRSAVIEIRRLSAQLFPLRVDHPQRPALQEAIDDLVGGIQARADHVGIQLDDLFRLINEDLSSSRSGVNDHRPHGDHLRAMVDEINGAYADEATIKRNIMRLQQLLPGAVDRRIAADRACAGFLAGWPVRGGQRA